MTTIREIIATLEKFAPLPLQEDYDNSGLQVGLTETDDVSGVLLCLDPTEATIDEAVSKGCNMIVSHHPLIFRPIRKVESGDMVSRVLVKAIRNNVAIYSAHTNLDNSIPGVSSHMAERLGLTNVKALGSDSAGRCSGVIGEFESPLSENDFLNLVKDRFEVSCIRHNALLGRNIQKVALCGGSGAFLSHDACVAGADAFVTGEIGYHRFFGFDGVMKLVETGHYESEQYTVELLEKVLRSAFPELGIVRTSVRVNPVNYM